MKKNSGVGSSSTLANIKKLEEAREERRRKQAELA